MVLKATFKLNDAARASRAMGEASMRLLNRVIKSNQKALLNLIKSITIKILYQTDFYRAFIGDNTLSGELGIPSGENKSRIDAIFVALVDQIEINITPLVYRQGRTSGGIQVLIGPDAWEPLLEIAEANIQTSEYDLEWLRWVLKQGDKIIVSEHFVSFGINLGRSGSAIMISDPGSSWRVPPEYSGTTNDNFITRAFKDNIDTYTIAINNFLKSILGQ